MRHIIDPTDLTREELDEVLDLAMDIIANRSKYADVCLLNLYVWRTGKYLVHSAALLCGP